MGLFDAVQAMGQAVFGAYFTPGLLHRQTLDADGLVIQPPQFTDVPIKVQVDSISAIERTAGGGAIPDRAVRILVLSGGVSPAPTQDDEITADGVRYRIAAPIKSDPAKIGWDLMAVPV